LRQRTAPLEIALLFSAEILCQRLRHLQMFLQRRQRVRRI
jgi:hypothetical protein